MPWARIFFPIVIGGAVLLAILLMLAAVPWWPTDRTVTVAPEFEAHRLLGYTPEDGQDVVLNFTVEGWLDSRPLEILPLVDDRLTYAPHDASARRTLSVAELRELVRARLGERSHDRPAPRAGERCLLVARGALRPLGSIFALLGGPPFTAPPARARAPLDGAPYVDGPVHSESATTLKSFRPSSVLKTMVGSDPTVS